MRVPALKCLGGIFMLLFRACLKAATDDASLTSFVDYFMRVKSRERKSRGTDLC